MLVMENGGIAQSQKQRIINDYGLEVIDEFELASLSRHVVVFRTDRDSREFMHELIKLKAVLGAQSDYIYRSMALPDQSTEPMQDLQNLASIIDFEKLHRHNQGKNSRIAIVDSGVDRQHQDLRAANIEAENFIRKDAYRGELHGTAVAGIIAAQRNGIGIMGLAPQTKMLALRACRQLQAGRVSAECYSSSLARAIDYAIGHKAQLANLSFGTPESDPLISNLLEMAAAKGMVLVGSAGNDPAQEQADFPARHPAVITVAGRDGGRYYPTKAIARHANILAPAEQIFSTVTENKYNFVNGTSISSAIASGILTLALSNRDEIDLLQQRSDVAFCDWATTVLAQPVCK
jgi:subtilisin family serine protease